LGEHVDDLNDDGSLPFIVLRPQLGDQLVEDLDTDQHQHADHDIDGRPPCSAPSVYAA
jgi:hypothetical protein